MKEGNYREYGGCSCYFHPKEVVVGVCHLCLNERLVVLAAKQGVKSKSSKLGLNHEYSNCKTSNNTSFNHSLYHHKPKSYVSLPKLFGIASFFNSGDKFHRQHRRRRESDRNFADAADVDDDDDDDDDADATSTSIEDESFISIKFGDNGVASWDKSSSNVSKMSQEHCSLSRGGQTSVKDGTLKGSDSNYYTHKSVVEHAKPRPPLLRWRKRIGQLLQVIRWKKSSKVSNGGGGGGGNNKVVRNHKSWIRTLKIRTKE